MRCILAENVPVLSGRLVIYGVCLLSLPRIPYNPRVVSSHIPCKSNKPRTAKVGAISKAQNLKGGPFGLCETPAGCKKFLKN